MSGNSAQRHSAASLFPTGTSGGATAGSGRESGIDIFNAYDKSPNPDILDVTKPHVPFIQQRQE